MSLLDVRALARSFGGVHALRGVSFALEPGELLAMIGPNGAGKTTCFNLLDGQLRPDAGEIRLDGRRIDGQPPRRLCRLGVGRTFQVAATFRSMSARENVRVGAFSAAADRPDHVARILDQAGITHLAEQPCSELAYGDLKRVELAIALASRPRLLLMDEPTAGMAAAERHALMALIAGISKAQGVSVLFTEHDMDVVFAHATRVLVLAEGELIAQGTPAEVRADARVRRVYLGEETAHA